MVEKPEDAIFNSTCEDIRKARALTEDQKKTLIKVFGKRFTAAYKAIEEGRVRKYVFRPSRRTMWIVAGREKDYQILPRANFCSCFDFYFRVIDYEISFCYHLIAQKLAEALERYIVIEDDDTNFIPLMEKWRKTVGQKRVLSIEEVKNVRKVVEEILLVERKITMTRLLSETNEAGFSVLTARHLTNILIADKSKRFRHADGLWMLIQ